MILKLNKTNFTIIKVLFLDIEKVLVSNKISSGEKIYKYFIDYSYNNHKVKPLYRMLPKTTLM